MNGAATTLWARAIAQELARSGVREAVLAPGSRSTPLVLALAREGDVRMRVHPDERSVGFFALGVARASGRPAAVVTTSGTAVANLLPAVVEASVSGVPMLLLTADRPARLRGADANQTIDQPGIFGSYVRASVETAEATLQGPALRHLRAQICRAVAAAAGTPGGPVHVNVPFDKPLEPVGDVEELRGFSMREPLAAEGRGPKKPFTDIRRGGPAADADVVGELVRTARAARRPVIIAGPVPDPEVTGPAVARLAGVMGAPLLADPLSGARFAAPAPPSVPAYDLFLRDHDVRRRLEPDLILRVGRSPTSAAAQRYLFHHAGVPQVVVDGGGRWKDHGATAQRYLVADPAPTLRAVCDGVGVDSDVDPAWEEAWAAAGAAAAGEVRAARRRGAGEADVPAAVVEALGARGTLVVSNSMPVRDVDAFVLPAAGGPRVVGNRGASGIDGVVSTAFGVAAAREGPVACVLGDLALFHDQNGLLWSREPDAPVVFIVVDNDGGGIFHMLPVRDHEPWFTSFFTAPHGLDFRHAASMHGLDFRDVPPADVHGAVRDALEAGESVLIRVRTDGGRAQEERSDRAGAVIRSVRKVLG